MNNNNLDDNEVDIRNLEELFYGVQTLSKDEEKEINEMIKEVESKGFKEKLQAIACKNERKRENVIRIGRIYIGKTSCFIFVICLSVILTGGIVYAAV